MECLCIFATTSDGLFGECDAPTDCAFVAVDGGDTFTIGIAAGTGDVVGWGQAFYGELAEGPMEQCLAVACGSNHVLVLTKSGGVMAWGWNRFGQVAATAVEDIVNIPASVVFPTELQHPLSVRIVEIAAGGMHSMAIDSGGRVWAWGSNAYGQLGINSEMKQLHSPTRTVLPSKSQILHIAAGWGHSALISTKGEVLTFGWGLYNQLGHGCTQNEVQPIAVDALRGLDSDVVQIACGNWHTVALTASGDMYTWGWGRDGQLAQESVAAQVIPRVVSIPLSFETSDDAQDVVAIACGDRFTIAVCRDRSVHWWGPRPGGSMLSCDLTCRKSPQHVTWLPQGDFRVQKLAAGNSHAILLLEMLCGQAT
ncbi:hypothetical protein PsorP6_000429 [Peronosclerospora sorghi]|uniref:Uncharacterized protein n=1 Tax=Peronosclerospora sorghi TaxID=230839 RepID=A0ACC0WXV3_9STRA|nr:hypothetical protein PsorP6_000429 [Peronosclerospora sorghi]